ncbi:MAG TPA: hypothetical protein VNO34_10665 [Actinomycetota bacterium]|nr:hypothetical protein [Actinomycetota bacterium]
MDSLWGYAIAGYVLTAVAIGGYVAALHYRARRARQRAAAVAARRRPSRPAGSCSP